MWGESSKQCETNCQCSGLITDSFKLGSGSGSAKRRREEAVQHNFKSQMNPHTLKFSPLSPLTTPKRRVLGDIQNVPPSPFASKAVESPLTSRLLSSPFLKRSANKLSRVFEERTRFKMSHRENQMFTDLENQTIDFGKLESQTVDFRNLESRAFKEAKQFKRSNKENLDFGNAACQNFGRTKNRSLDFGSYEGQTSHSSKAKNRSLNFDRLEHRSFGSLESETIAFGNLQNENMSFGELENQAIAFSEIENQCAFGELENQTVAFRELEDNSVAFGALENQSVALEVLHSQRQPLRKLGCDEASQSSFLDSLGTPLGLQRSKTVKNWTLAKMTPEPTQRLSPKAEAPPVFGLDLDIADSDMDTLQDLDAEFENDNFEACSKYEIISTDSPDIISKGRTDTRKITAKNLGEFGAPIAETEQSTSFNLKPTVSATRMLNFEFMSPENFKRVTQKDLSVKKALKFTTDTPTKNFLRHESSCSSIGSMSMSPLSSKLSLCTSESTASMESGFISEVEEQFLDLEDSSNSPKMANFNDLLSGQIKQDFSKETFVLKRPVMQRSLSYNTDPCKVRVSLFEERKTQKRSDLREDFRSTKRRRWNCESAHPLVTKTQRPTLQRAFSENAASIMTALARSASEPDLIGDFSRACALPVTRGDHSDLKSISCETLAALLRGDYRDTICQVEVIDCRYPYEFEGGHIRGARNLYTPEMVLTLMESPPGSPRANVAPDSPAAGQVSPVVGQVSPNVAPAGTPKRRVLLFHCEFSLERGPKLSRYLRSADRARNADNYPSLRHPEVYLLHGGYAAFHRQHQEHCEPAGYTAMLDPRHKQSLRQARSMK